MDAGHIRNIAIIAHVDHGKTTLVDAILKQTGVFRDNQVVQERIMDSNELERERGITILSKNTSVEYRGYKINIVDTPGHADFGGEVERILSMVDGALLVVDAVEGPMPQTRFVLLKALKQELKPVVVVNKIDRPDARPREVVDEVLDLFIDLGADENQLEFPVVYTDARRGVAGLSTDALDEGILPLLDTVIDSIPPPRVNPAGPVAMLISTLDYDDYVGRVLIGRVHSGTLTKGLQLVLARPGGELTPCEISQLYTFSGLKRVPARQAMAGDIVAVTGIPEAGIGDTITDSENPVFLEPISVEEPTVSMFFMVNDGPFAGREGKYLTSRHLKDRLKREVQGDVGLRVEATESPNAFEVKGRGELHLSILIEKMRREGYEMMVSKPRVILREIDGVLSEPIEHLTVDVPEEYMGPVMEALGPRRGELRDFINTGTGRIRLEVFIPSRGLVGFRPEFLTITKGNGIMAHTFDSYGPYRGEIASRQNGSLVAWETGTVTAYALENAEERGTLFVGPGEEVYAGQVVGEHARPKDLDINVCKKKHVTNMRSSTQEEGAKLTPPRRLSLEEALEWIAEDELVEITPGSIRLRKRILDRNERKRT